ncbi:hypothetical protein PanWU01x14_350930 [Parasponia andersonii]|uniref:Uncharacterized protein n=1 Tax=Parasponia andersonii TaxID=3476 RepID=A0A2P5AAT7_PARAD|nr:hypothetical protein PanWU01x14_350930 [Parasponia andersonii]
MDLEEIAKLCELLKLDDHEGLVMRMNPEMYEDGKEKIEFYLVGRVFGNKFVNWKGLNEVAEQVWLTTRKIVKESCREIHGHLATN